MKNILSFALPLWIHFWIGSIKKDIPNKTLKVKLLSVFLEYLSISPTLLSTVLDYFKRSLFPNINIVISSYRYKLYKAFPLLLSLAVMS